MPGTGSRYIIPRLIPAPVRGANKKTMNNEFEILFNEFKLKLVQKDASFNELYEVLVQMKNNNVEKQVAYDVLNQVGQLSLTNEQEEMLLDLMDIVVGYCSPGLRLWD